MSIEAINWAKRQRVTPTQKLVLLVLADCADPTGVAFPSTAYLEEITGLSDKAIRTAKKAMIGAGILIKERWMRVNDIRLSMSDNSAKTEPHSIKTEPSSENAVSRSTNKKTEPRSELTEPHSIKTEPRSAVPEPPITTKNHHYIPPNPPAKKSAGKFELPDWVPLDAWQGWLEMRRGKKCPATQRALELAVRDLSKLRAEGNDPGSVLDQSTQRGWRGLFPLKNQQNGGGNVVPFGQPKPKPSNPFEGFADGFDVEIPDLTPDQKAAWLRYGGQP